MLSKIRHGAVVRELFHVDHLNFEAVEGDALSFEASGHEFLLVMPEDLSGLCG